MIPEAKKEAVARGLREAFGVTEFEGIERLTAGMSAALVFRIVVEGRAYLLRIILNTAAAPGPGQGDPTRQFACMRSAAEVWIAPRVWYTSIEDGVSITDFVEAQAFPIREALALIPAALQKLHALPPFPRAVNYHPLRWRPSLAGGLGGHFPERPVLRSGGGGEFCRYQRRRGRGLSQDVFRGSSR